MSLNTGANRPKGFQATKKAAELLIRDGAQLLRPLSDARGIYAYFMKIGGQPFYLVARSTPPMVRQWRNIVSSQRAILIRAREDRYPLVMAVFMTVDPKRPAWKLYHPEEVLVKQYGENVRGRIVMVNFEYALGEMILDVSSVPVVWRRVRDAWDTERSATGIQTKLGSFKTAVNPS